MEKTGNLILICYYNLFYKITFTCYHVFILYLTCVLTFWSIIYENSEHYLNTRRQNYEINAILWKIQHALKYREHPFCLNTP